MAPHSDGEEEPQSPAPESSALRNASVATALQSADLDGAQLPENERALLEFVGVITQHAHQVTDDHVGRLRDLGWNDVEISEAVYVASLFALFNRVADAFGLGEQH